MSSLDHVNQSTFIASAGHFIKNAYVDLKVLPPTVHTISMGLNLTIPPSAISLCMQTWANIENTYFIFEWTCWPAVWARGKGEWWEMSPKSQWLRTPSHPSMGIKEIQSRKKSCKYSWLQWAKKLSHKRSNFTCQAICCSTNKGIPVGNSHNKGRYPVLWCAK